MALGVIDENRVTEFLGSEYPFLQGAMRLINLEKMAPADPRVDASG